MNKYDLAKLAGAIKQRTKKTLQWLAEKWLKKAGAINSAGDCQLNVNIQLIWRHAI